jgi:hypothetical protein
MSAGGNTYMLDRRSVVMMMLVCCASRTVAAAPRETTGTVSIRIHDYAQIDGRQLQQAERRISEIYDSIGVRLDWRAVARPSEIEAGRGRWPDDATALVTIVILGAEMGDRLKASNDVAGYAPITREHGGRIAFVFGEKTRTIAEDGGAEQSDVLAGIIAHELAHLLMPERSHSNVGVMRPHWSPVEFRRIVRARFSASEGASIRQTVRSMSGQLSRVAD